MKTNANDIKHRDIVFTALPLDQASQAMRLLKRLEGIQCQAHPEQHKISLQYNLNQHRLVDLEERLQAAGFHLDNSILQKILRALAHYSEEVHHDNQHIPEHNVKSRDVYAKVWENHPHGDHDDTPEELRRYL